MPSGIVIFVKAVQPSKSVSADHEKIINREVIRLRMSLDAAKSLQKESGKEIIAFFHFPPIWSEFECPEILNVLTEYNITKCYFGHIHGNYTVPPSITENGIKYTLISADFVSFGKSNHRQ